MSFPSSGLGVPVAERANGARPARYAPYTPPQRSARRNTQSAPPAFGSFEPRRPPGVSQHTLPLPSVVQHALPQPQSPVQPALPVGGSAAPAGPASGEAAAAWRRLPPKVLQILHTELGWRGPESVMGLTETAFDAAVTGLSGLEGFAPSLAAFRGPQFDEAAFHQALMAAPRQEGAGGTPHHTWWSKGAGEHTG